MSVLKNDYRQVTAVVHMSQRNISSSQETLHRFGEANCWYETSQTTTGNISQPYWSVVLSQKSTEHLCWTRCQVHTSALLLGRLALHWPTTSATVLQHHRWRGPQVHTDHPRRVEMANSWWKMQLYEDISTQYTSQTDRQRQTYRQTNTSALYWQKINDK